jgi:hypothetical protein
MLFVTKATAELTIRQTRQSVEGLRRRRDLRVQKMIEKRPTREKSKNEKEASKIKMKAINPYKDIPSANI